MKLIFNSNLFRWSFWTAMFMLTWCIFPSELLPRPLEVLIAIGKMWQDGFVVHLIASYQIQLYALVISFFLSLVLAYSATFEFFRPVVVFISNLRFISVGPLVLFFIFLISSNGDTIKLWLLVFSVSVFYITSMLDEVTSIPQEEFDHAKTLGMNRLQVLWEVVIYGKLDIALELFRQNAAIGWMMITMVEGIVKGSGGIGNLLLVKQKYLNLPEILGIIIVLFIIGMVQDQLLIFIRRFLFPFSTMDIKK